MWPEWKPPWGLQLKAGHIQHSAPTVVSPRPPSARQGLASPRANQRPWGVRALRVRNRPDVHQQNTSCASLARELCAGPVCVTLQTTPAGASAPRHTGTGRSPPRRRTELRPTADLRGHRHAVMKTTRETTAFTVLK